MWLIYKSQLWPSAGALNEIPDKKNKIKIVSFFFFFFIYIESKMAESVQYYLERMIPELEALEKKNIFTPVGIFCFVFNVKKLMTDR